MRLPIRILFFTVLLATCNAPAQPAATPSGVRATGVTHPNPGAPDDRTIELSPLRVTADLWESPLARISASVSVFERADLETGAVRHFGDLVDQVPNLTWTGGTSRPRYLQIRGVGENSQFEGETPDSAVRFLIDDLDFTGLGTVASTFDVSQVEVLRGPQAGAFGANAAGGVVRLVTQAPTPVWTGQVEGSLGEDALRTFGVAVGGPLLAARPDQLMVRLAVQQSESDGFRRNLTLNRDTNARDEQTARLRLVFNPTADWRWDATFFAADLANGYDEFALDNNGRSTFSDQPGRDEQRSVASSVRGTWSGADAFRFTSVSSVARTRSRYAYDDDWTAASYMGFSDLRRLRWVVNQELRVDSEPATLEGWISRWTAGVFYSDTDEFSRYANVDPENIRGLVTHYRGRNYAAFGQIGHDFTTKTRLILGLRAERMETEGNGTVSRVRLVPGTRDPERRIAPAFNDTVWGGKITLEHDLTPEQLVFASLSRGYKAGGVNIDARIDPGSDPLTYDTETLWNVEVGFRGNWLQQRLRGEVTAFYLLRDETQVRDSAGFGGNYRFFTDNGDESVVYGLESSGSFAITSGWKLRGSLALMRSELDPFTLVNGNTGGGRELANTPEYGYSVGTRWGREQGVFAQADLVGRAQQFDSNNQNESRRAFRVVNASIGYAWQDWIFTVWAKNLLDEDYDKRVYFFGNEDPDYVPTRYENRADPRQIGVTAVYRF